MDIITEKIPLKTRGHSDIIDITKQAQNILDQSGLTTGTITFFVAGATAGITTIEYEPGLLKDLPELYDKLAPEDADYHHDATWHDGNGNSHVRAAFQGPSLVVPFINSHMMLGTWQQVVLIDFDNRPRSREVILQIMGQRNQ